MAEISLRRFLELAKHHCADLGRRVLLAVDVHFDQFGGTTDDLVGDQLLFRLYLIMATAHEPLDREDRSPRVGNRLPLGRIPYQALSLVCKSNDAGGQPIPFLVRDDLDLPALHDSHHGVGRPQVDADDFFTLCHSMAPFSFGWTCSGYSFRNCHAAHPFTSSNPQVLRCYDLIT